MVERLLIDASHPEETRVAIAKDSRLEEFDFESTSKKQIKNNIYLAKVTRVEPSLQAAFVEYGGNRQGFLPFSEIHLDYYQIPVADKEKLAASMGEEAPGEAENAEEEKSAKGKKSAKDAGEEKAGESEDQEASAADEVDVFDDLPEDMSKRRTAILRKYNIQEVIKRNQVLLVQVIKEERGNKGASLTTYISLAGRYCVLMPNSPRTGGVSRRIANPDDRKRLKKTIDDLETADGMSVIIRTAGINARKTEITRDFKYLKELWDGIRKQAISSEAPALVHEEGNLINRALRDMYTNEVDEIIIQGQEATEETKKILKQLAPTHVKKVREHKEKAPIFRHYNIEDELAKLYDGAASLESGGSIVITPTEALVSIDVNSGRATKERNIEETALKTNMEAAREISRQLRLRDLAGLIVIDFIDMLQLRNKRAVERELKDALKADRARIQVGRISMFGLLEMSRQRMRPSIVEAHTNVCPRCSGSGVVRSPESTALMILRAIESEASKGKSEEVCVRTSMETALYVLNNKHPEIIAVEAQYGMRVVIESDQDLAGEQFSLDKSRAFSRRKRPDSQQRQRGGNRHKKSSPSDRHPRDNKGKRGSEGLTKTDGKKKEEAGNENSETKAAPVRQSPPVKEAEDKKVASDGNSEEKKPSRVTRGRGRRRPDAGSSSRGNRQKAPSAAGEVIDTPAPREKVADVPPTAEDERTIKNLWKKMTS